MLKFFLYYLESRIEKKIILSSCFKKNWMCHECINFNLKASNTLSDLLITSLPVDFYRNMQSHIQVYFVYIMFSYAIVSLELYTKISPHNVSITYKLFTQINWVIRWMSKPGLFGSIQYKSAVAYSCFIAQNIT